MIKTNCPWLNPVNSPPERKAGLNTPFPGAFS